MENAPWKHQVAHVTVSLQIVCRNVSLQIFEVFEDKNWVSLIFVYIARYFIGTQKHALNKRVNESINEPMKEINESSL